MFRSFDWMRARRLLRRLLASAPSPRRRARLDLETLEDRLTPATTRTVSISDARLVEGDTQDGVMRFTLTLSHAAARMVEVSLQTRDGTALAGSDYVGTSRTVKFSAGQVRKTIGITVKGDLRDEADEFFRVVLTGARRAVIGDGVGIGTIVDNDAPPPPPPLPGLTINDVAVVEENATAAGFFHTQGNQIVDAGNRPVKIAGVNWFGMETLTFAPHGLWTRNWRDMMDQMKAEGFNTIRLPFSNQLFDAGSVPNGIDFDLNPELRGLTGLQIMDRIVDYAGQLGLRIILDHHRSEAGSGPNGNGLWYTSAYPESRWISDWRMLAARYAGNPTVIGADLHNEPHGPATWGSGNPSTDWRLAAERAGNAILAVNPSWLIVVEGIESYGGQYYWWGGNLAGARDFPVRLDVPNRLVYSPHDYPASVYPQSWFTAPDYPNNLRAVWDRTWGYLFREGLAPVWLGEFGSRLETTVDRLWAQEITEYLAGDLDGDGASDLAPGQLGMSWTWWSWNPNSGDTGGILLDDWRTVDSAKMQRLGPIQFSWPEAGSGPAEAVFQVALSTPSTQTVTVDFRTADGTARAGDDFTAGSGSLAFAPGETLKTIRVPILADTLDELDETFFVRLLNPVNATVFDGEGIGTILDNDQSDTSPPSESPPSPPPETSPAVEVGFRVTDDWGTGFVAEVTLTNRASTSLDNWTLAFDFDRQIGSIWNAVIVGHEGQRYVFQPVDWNRSIAAGQSIAFGFSGSPGNVTAGPTNIVVTASGSATSGTSTGGTTSPAGGRSIVLAGVDDTGPATQVFLDPGLSEFPLSLDGQEGTFRVTTSNGGVVRAAVAGQLLRLEGLAAGRASLRIEETATGTVRYLGVQVRTADGRLPGLPDYLAIGSVSEDTAADLAFWQDFASPTTSKRIDIRYIYLNGGPFNGWRTWSSTDGGRLVSYLRESQKLGIVPYFVWYNIPDGGESYWTDLQHVQDSAYMEAYFRDLKFALDLIRTEAADQYVGMVLEPDFLGYLMQNSGLEASQIAARTQAAYAAGVLDAAVDPLFADNVQGLVQAINYTIGKYAANVSFGWQFNLWASPGLTTSIPATGIVHLTDTLGLVEGRAAIAREARLIAEWYVRAGVLSYGADFLALDKYGLDAAAEPGAADNPAASTWFWNSDHWHNYLLFTRTLHETTGLPVVLWQIPVGHINGSLAVNPYDPGGLFPDLTNDFTRYEDSAATFFLGDSFTASGDRFDYFATNDSGDWKLTVSGSTITWGAHLEEARQAGIVAILFGAGVGASTDGVGSPPTDGYWWISQVQEYYLDPLLLSPPS